MTRILLWAAAALGVLLLLWRVDHLSNDRMTLQLNLDQANARAESLRNTLRIQRELNADLAEMDRKHTEELSHAQAESSRLAADVAAGERRLRIKASCPDTRVPDTARTAGVDDAGTAELHPTARQDYFALRGQLIRTEAALAGLQEYVSEVCQGASP